MENEERPTPAYLKGFNEGYALTQHMPELADQISKSLGKVLDSERGTGFNDGRKQSYMDKTKSLYPAYLRQDRDIDLDLDKDVEKDRDLGDLDKG
jgi:hypothetical protein